MRFSLTMFALYLGLLSIPGFFFAFSDLIEQVPKDVVDFSGVRGIAMRLVSLVYGATALLASIGLFEKRAWARLATRVWMGACLGLIVIMAALFPMEMMPGGMLGYAGFIAIVLIVLFVIDRVVHRGLMDST